MSKLHDNVRHETLTSFINSKKYDMYIIVSLQNPLIQESARATSASVGTSNNSIAKLSYKVSDSKIYYAIPKHNDFGITSKPNSAVEKNIDGQPYYILSINNPVGDTIYNAFYVEHEVEALGEEGTNNVWYNTITLVADLTNKDSVTNLPTAESKYTILNQHTYDTNQVVDINNESFTIRMLVQL